jgi:hypothetical protein
MYVRVGPVLYFPSLLTSCRTALFNLYNQEKLISFSFDNFGSTQMSERQKQHYQKRVVAFNWLFESKEKH